MVAIRRNHTLRINGITIKCRQHLFVVLSQEPCSCTVLIDRITIAGHNLSDVLGLVMAWVASWLATQKATDRNTYGLKKSTILAALFNSLFLIAAVGGIAWEAIGRFSEPAEVTGLTVIVVAGIGVIINGLTMLLFMKGQEGDLNTVSYTHLTLPTNREV